MISLPLLKAHLKVNEDETADDALIVEMEEAAVAFMENETGKYFGELSEITEVLSANGWAPIWLRATPLADSDDTPVLLESRTYPNGSWAEVAATDYEIDGQRLYPLAYWIPGSRTLRLTYWAGSDVGGEPADVRQAVRELVTRMYEKRMPYVDSSVVDLVAGVREVIRAHRVQVVG